MIIRKILFLWVFLFFSFSHLSALSLLEEFKQSGYLEICDTHRDTTKFDSLYAYFDELIEFLQNNPVWARKLYIAKERFIRSKDKKFYSTDFFGFYDDSEKKGRNQISFYYSIHFHQFIYSHYPEFNQIPQVTQFFEACLEIQKSYEHLFELAAVDLNVEKIFSANNDHPPILFKVIKYFPSYAATKPHYDGTAFSLFLDSTDNQSLLMSPYKSSFSLNDFASPVRAYQNSILLIPGAHLTEFGIYPTPHIVRQSGKIRYATIAFAMRPKFTIQKNELSSLPNF